MNPKDVKKFEKQLLHAQNRLTTGIEQIERDNLYQAGMDGNSSDPTSYAEVGTESFERETNLRVVHNEAEYLREVADALKRINAGTFGHCEGCDQLIPKKRLEFSPEARYCITCQSKIERHGYL